MNEEPKCYWNLGRFARVTWTPLHPRERGRRGQIGDIAQRLLSDSSISATHIPNSLTSSTYLERLCHIPTEATQIELCPLIRPNYAPFCGCETHSSNIAVQRLYNYQATKEVEAVKGQVRHMHCRVDSSQI